MFDGSKKAPRDDIDRLPIVVRDALPEDLNFIFNSWLVSYKHSRNNLNIAHPFYYQGQHKVCERILRQAHTLVLADKNINDNIFGYVIYEFVDGVYVLHYAYTKHTYRNLGLFHHMLKLTRGEQTTGIYTHDSKNARYVGDKVGLYYNPYTLFDRLKPLPDQELGNEASVVAGGENVPKHVVKV